MNNKRDHHLGDELGELIQEALDERVAEGKEPPSRKAFMAFIHAHSNQEEEEEVIHSEIKNSALHTSHRMQEAARRRNAGFSQSVSELTDPILAIIR